MPSHGSYAINNREEGKAAQRDQSYRSCVLTLLIFFLLCTILILASWPWKKSYNNYHSEQENNSVDTAKFEGKGLETVEPDLEIDVDNEKNRTIMSDVNKSTKSPELPAKSEETFERYLNNAPTESTQLPVNREETFERYLNNASTESTQLPVNSEETFERYLNNASTEATQLPVNREEMFERYINKVATEEPEISVIPEETFKLYANNTSTETTELPVSLEELFEQYLNVSTESSQFLTTRAEYLEQYLNNASTKQLEINSTRTKTTKHFQNIVNTENTEATLQTSPIPEKEEIIFNSEQSILTNTERTYKSTLNETQLISTEIFTPKIEEISTDYTEIPNDYSTSLITKIKDSIKEEQTSQRPIKDYTSLLRLVVAKYFGNESTTLRNEGSGENWLNEMEDQTNIDRKELPNTSEPTKILSSTNKWIYTKAMINSERATSNEHTEKQVQDTTAISLGEITSSSLENIKEEEEDDVCTTGSCKQIASKLLSYMNHSADPCEDFYEYACGGFQADYQIKEKDLSLRVYETIERQAKKYKNHSEYLQFNNYYDSCLKYEAHFNIEHRIDLAREALEKIGKFYTTANWPKGFQGFTQLFANMLLQDRPLLFDIVPDVNETNPEAFTLKIGPAIDNKIFQFANGPDPCDIENQESLQSYVDLDQLYYNYKNCKKDKRTFVASIKQALTELGIFDSLKNTYNISQYIDRTVINIDLDIIENILRNYPPESEIREAYRSKHYTVMTLSALQGDCKLLNWTQLINSLTGLTLEPNAQLQIYYKDQLIGAMRQLEELGRRQNFDLNNALLGLYARNLYQDLVVTRSTNDLHKHCLYIATHLMEREASELYMSSFTENEIRSMKSVMGNLFRDLKETLRLEIRRSEWAEERGREVLIKKLSDIKMSMPSPFFMKNKDTHELNITDNYFVNTMNLMKKYRFVIYSVIKKNPRHLEQIWTFFASPFEWTARTIYGLNLIIMPFGAIERSIVSEIGQSFDYLIQATIGNLIAREIAHNFDTNGIRYWNGSRDSEFALLTDSDATKSTYEEYIDCHRNSLYQESMEMSLPITGQRVSFTISSLSLNERLSDVMGMRLANDTLARLGSDATIKRLPWLDLDVSQLFYLAYAQTHCTKATLASSYVALHENPFLPSRLRVFVVASNNKFLSEAWKCPEGSKISPAFMCDAFPHLENRAAALDAV